MAPSRATSIIRLAPPCLSLAPTPTSSIASTTALLSRTFARSIHTQLRSTTFPRPVVSRTVPGFFFTASASAATSAAAPSRRWGSTAATATATNAAGSSSGAGSGNGSGSAVEAPDYLDEGELKIFEILKAELQPLKLEVQDVSGGCGSMYALDIVAEQFRGLSVIKQHRLVNKVLGEEIKKWHGVQLKTKAPPSP